jgi:hypothetical protein
VGPTRVPSKEDALGAVDRLLAALETGADVLDALDAIGPLHPKDNTFPGEIFMCIAADALLEGGIDRSNPISQERIVSRYLPECEFRGRNNQKFRFALLAAAATHAGVEVDLLDEVPYWGSDDFWRYAGLAAVAWVRAVADEKSISLPDLCGQLRTRAESRLADF